jgi:uncharacterized membrane-anchored protein
MHFPTIILSLLAFAITVIAGSTAKVHPRDIGKGTYQIGNYCPFDVYLWSIGGHNGPVAERHTIPPMASFSESFWVPEFGGVSVKISRESELSRRILQFEYTISSQGISYDLSNVDTVNGNPFSGYDVELDAGECTHVLCPGYLPTCTAAFIRPGDTQNVRHCTTDARMMLTLCSGPLEADASP